MDYQTQLRHRFPESLVIGSYAAENTIPMYPVGEECLELIVYFKKFSNQSVNNKNKGFYQNYINSLVKQSRKNKKLLKSEKLQVILNHVKPINKAEEFFVELYCNLPNVNKQFVSQTIKSLIKQRKYSSIRKDIKISENIDKRIKQLNQKKKSLNAQKKKLLPGIRKKKKQLQIRITKERDKFNKFRNDTKTKITKENKKKLHERINIRQIKYKKLRAELVKQKKAVEPKSGIGKVRRSLSQTIQLIQHYKDKKETFIYSVRHVHEILQEGLNEIIKENYRTRTHEIIGIPEDLKIDRKKKYVPGFTGNDEMHHASHSKRHFEKTKAYTANRKTLRRIRRRKNIKTLYDLDEGDFNEEDLVSVKMRQLKPYYKRVEKYKVRTAIVFLIDYSADNYQKARETIQPIMDHPAIYTEIYGFHSVENDFIMSVTVPDERRFITRQSSEEIRYYKIEETGQFGGIEVAGKANYGEAMNFALEKISRRKEKTRIICLVGDRKSSTYNEQVKPQVLDDFFQLKVKQAKSLGIKVAKSVHDIIS